MRTRDSDCMHGGDFRIVFIYVNQEFVMKHARPPIGRPRPQTDWYGLPTFNQDAYHSARAGPVAMMNCSMAIRHQQDFRAADDPRLVTQVRLTDEMRTRRRTAVGRFELRNNLDALVTIALRRPAYFDCMAGVRYSGCMAWEDHQSMRGSESRLYSGLPLSRWSGIRASMAAWPKCPVLRLGLCCCAYAAGRVRTA
ncbi:hypothetical protein IE81DRAFT_106494 [Ceraceosorus guamensis]|uniref:Uncharacterized protein n=1 Tax=Ceraceosorus guamensis TaxID=1522189 RepID=A0A316W2X6_9BASI|nr:hypothetical protein IE81DRAFT_106494 [Ceraceosorus guamensis]PWN42941.1 hypothetical protein IE81DRAFT_106494 [Ceraceosorus guamensis]